MIAAPIVVGSLFTGIAGLELGLERALVRAGHPTRVAWQAEINPFCRAVLAKHYPEATQYADVRSVDAQSEPVDLICGGFPCQDISLAGKGAGLAGARSGLWSEYARVVRVLRPRFVVVENVAALLGRGFGDVLRDLAALGYDAWWDCIPAAAVGAPHRRDRLFMVAWRVSDANSDGLRQLAERGGGAAQTPDGRHAIDRDVGKDLADSDAERWERSWTPRQWFAGPTISSGDVAHRNGMRQLQSQGSEPDKRGRLEHGGGWPPAPNDMHAWGRVQTDAQPSFCRLADGVSDLVLGRRARLHALGNAVVPQVAEVCGQVIADLIAREASA